MLGFIYEVIDTEGRRYIGQTVRPDERPEESRRRHDGVRVRMLEVNLPDDVLNAAENYWMARRLVEGHEILNIHTGGWSSAGRAGRGKSKPGAGPQGPLSDSHRAAISAGLKGHKRSPETCARMSAALKGRAPTRG